jgi:hypothetical protein
MLERASICSCSATVSARRCAFSQKEEDTSCLPPFAGRRNYPVPTHVVNAYGEVYCSVWSEETVRSQTLICAPPLHPPLLITAFYFSIVAYGVFKMRIREKKRMIEERFQYSMIIEWSAEDHAIRLLSQSRLPGLQPRISEEPTENGARIGDRSPRYDPLHSRPRCSN